MMNDKIECKICGAAADGIVAKGRDLVGCNVCIRVAKAEDVADKLRKIIDGDYGDYRCPRGHELRKDDAVYLDKDGKVLGCGDDIDDKCGYGYYPLYGGIYASDDYSLATPYDEVLYHADYLERCPRCETDCEIIVLDGWGHPIGCEHCRESNAENEVAINEDGYPLDYDDLVRMMPQGLGDTYRVYSDQYNRYIIATQEEERIERTRGIIVGWDKNGIGEDYD